VKQNLTLWFDFSVTKMFPKLLSSQVNWVTALLLLMQQFNHATCLLSGFYGGGRSCLTNQLTKRWTTISKRNHSNLSVARGNPDETTARKDDIQIGIIGGGASGIFAACAASEAKERFTKICESKGYPPPKIGITVLEATNLLMTKVKVSGGGRCNVLHDTTKPLREILQSYPRGEKELAGILSKRFTPQMARNWFESQGVELKTEADGRMFPTSDNSKTIIDTLYNAAVLKGGVQIEKATKIRAVLESKDGKFQVFTSKALANMSEDTGRIFDAIILATGSSPTGHEIASNLGHTIVQPVPSLFSLRLAHDVKAGGLLHGLSGLSLKNVRISVKVDCKSNKDEKPSEPLQLKKNQHTVQQKGPILITHEGISGPASLKLSAFAARIFNEVNYHGIVHLHLAPDIGKIEDIEQIFIQQKQTASRKLVSSTCPLVYNEINYENYNTENGTFEILSTRIIPKRLWTRLCEKAGIASTSRWADVSKKNLRALADIVVHCPFEVTGKSTNKEEFVTAGGVQLKEIDMTTMQSKLCPGLFFCGECIDVDGVTGGFNFMNCWGTGHVAGTSAVAQFFI